MAGDLKAFLKAAASRTDTYLRGYLGSLKESPKVLTEAMAYSLLGPGKRIRPALALLCYDAVGGDAGKAEGLVMPPAGAIEMVHCFSLIHDDLPAMDDDDLRRGRPTNHKVFGEALAILAGDGLNTLAFQLIVDRVSEAGLAVKLVRELAWATGPEGMIGGQVLDTCHPEEAKKDPEGNRIGPALLPKLQQIHRMKTGALIRCACRMGAMAAGAEGKTLEEVDVYGRAIGLAFQIVDDILDVTSTEEQMGKKVGKDAEKGKLTYPVLVGLEKSREYLSEQVRIADGVAERLGEKAGMMSMLAHDLAERTN